MPLDNLKYTEPKLEEKPVTDWTVICPNGYEGRFIGSSFTTIGTINGTRSNPKPNLSDYVCVSTSKGTSGSE